MPADSEPLSERPSADPAPSEGTGPLPGGAEVSLRVRGPAALVTVTGHVDILSARQLWARAHEGFNTPGCRVVVVDLTRVAVLDSLGIAALLELHKHARRRGLTLRTLIRPDQPIRRILRLCGADLVLNLEP